MTRPEACRCRAIACTEAVVDSRFVDAETRGRPYCKSKIQFFNVSQERIESPARKIIFARSAAETGGERQPFIYSGRGVNGSAVFAERNICE